MTDAVTDAVTILGVDNSTVKIDAVTTRYPYRVRIYPPYCPFYTLKRPKFDRNYPPITLYIFIGIVCSPLYYNVLQIYCSSSRIRNPFFVLLSSYYALYYSYVVDLILAEFKRLVFGVFGDEGNCLLRGASSYLF